MVTTVANMHEERIDSAKGVKIFRSSWSWLPAAALRPDATLSLALLEPGAFALAQRNPAARALSSADGYNSQ